MTSCNQRGISQRPKNFRLCLQPRIQKLNWSRSWGYQPYQAKVRQNQRKSRIWPVDRAIVKRKLCKKTSLLKSKVSRRQMASLTIESMQLLTIHSPNSARQCFRTKIRGKTELFWAAIESRPVSQSMTCIEKRILLVIGKHCLLRAIMSMLTITSLTSIKHCKATYA